MSAPFEGVSVEQVREYWNRRPCNIRHSPKPVGTKEDFDEAEARKDFVYSFGVTHHSPHRERILEQATSYQNPGGTLKLMVYNRRSWKVLWMVLKYGRGDFRKTQQLIAEHSEAQFGSPVTYAYTTK